jgi:hypothetical protein
VIRDLQLPSGLSVALVDTYDPLQVGCLVNHLRRTRELLLPRPPQTAAGIDLSAIPRYRGTLSVTRSLELRSLLDACNDLAPSEEALVLVWAPVPYVELVSLYAAGVGASIQSFQSMEDLQALRIAHRCRALTIVGPPELFSSALVDWSWAVQDSSQTRIGFVPARDWTEFAWFALKRLAAPQIYENFKGAAVLVRDTASGLEYQSGVVRESAFDAPAVANLRKPHQFVTCEFHAKETCAKFNEHVFCGLPAGKHTQALDGAKPGCASGAPCVWSTLNRIEAIGLPAAHVVAVSCGSLRVGDGLFANEYGLGLNIFRASSRSLISPNRFVVASALLTGLVCDLAMSGEPLGEIAFQANKWIQLTQADAPPFVLLGDPADKIDLDAALDSEIAAPAGQPALLSATSSASSMAEETGASIGGIPAGLARYVEHRRPGIRDHGALLGAMTAIDASTGLWPSLTYMDNHRVESRGHECFICGQRCITYVRGGDGEAWEREVVNCPRCGVIADLPASSYGEVTLIADTKVSRGDALTVQSSAKFPSTETGIKCAFSLIQADVFGWPDFAAMPISILPTASGWQASMRTVVPESAYEFVYWLRVTWITPASFYWLSRPLTLN